MCHAKSTLETKNNTLNTSQQWNFIVPMNGVLVFISNILRLKSHTFPSSPANIHQWFHSNSYSDQKIVDRIIISDNWTAMKSQNLEEIYSIENTKGQIHDRWYLLIFRFVWTTGRVKICKWIYRDWLAVGSRYYSMCKWHSFFFPWPKIRSRTKMLITHIHLIELKWVEFAQHRQSNFLYLPPDGSDQLCTIPRSNISLTGERDIEIKNSCLLSQVWRHELAA